MKIQTTPLNFDGKNYLNNHFQVVIFKFLSDNFCTYIFVQSTLRENTCSSKAVYGAKIKISSHWILDSPIEMSEDIIKL